MTPRRLAPWILLFFGIFGIIGLGAWDYFSIRSATFDGNAAWVRRVSDMVTAERLSLNRSLGHFSSASHDFLLSRLPEMNDSITGLMIEDMKTHHRESWAERPLKRAIQSPDPRLIVLQLKALESRQTQTGPVVLIDEKPYYTAVAPLHGNDVLIGYAAAKRLSTILATEARLWRRHAFVYDFDGNMLFASRAPTFLKGAAMTWVHRARAGKTSGLVDVNTPNAWQWLASYHYDPASDWIFIVAQSTAWTYLPLISFVACLLALLWMVRVPYKAAEQLRLQRYKSEVATFAKRVDDFVHGKAPGLKEPPFIFPELTPIVTALRWMMPQWQKAAQYPNELGLERKLLGLLIESLPEAILFFNAQGSLQLSNELGRVFFALQQEPGHEYKLVNGMQVPRGFLEPFTEPVFTGAQKNMGKELDVAWADGKHLYRVWVEAVEASEGSKSDGYIVVIRDITFRRSWEVVQEQVLSGITHDLRGPLSAVMGYLDLMKRQVGDNGNPKMLEYLKMARDAGVRLTQMVSDILDVVRFEQGKIDLTIEPIPVADIFKRLKNIFSVTAEQKKITLRLTGEGPTDMKTFGDPKLLERIFDNLVGNALKFTPSGGTITVSAKRGKGRMLFEVADTGRGIPREAQSRIFDKFQQVRPGDRSAGYGLGLAVVKFIVDAHQGEIRVESEVGQGSRFSFWIPDRPEVVASNQGVTPMNV